MKILVLNGSPHANGATSDMVNAFSNGATDAGHEVVSINVAHKNVKGCMACEYHAFGTAAGCDPSDLLDRYSEEREEGRTDYEFRQCVCVRTRYRPVLSIHR